MGLKSRILQRGSSPKISFTELGFGTAGLGNLYRAVSEDDSDAALQAAWDGGIRYFDTAPLYGFGLSETRLNRFLRGKDRDSYVLSTKIGRLLKPATPETSDAIGKFFDVPSRKEHFDYSYDGVMWSVEFSLERLGLDRIDILLAHDLDIFSHGSQEAVDPLMEEFLNGGYKALLSLREQGVIAGFGAGVNEWQICQYMAERGDFDMFLLAGRYTLLEQEALNSFLPLCEKQNIGIILGGPYNSGILATGAVPGAKYNYDDAPADVMDRVSRIDAVCRDHGVAMVDAAFQFPLGHPNVLSVIPGAQSAREVGLNLKAAEADIPVALWADLKQQGLVREEAPTPG
jgi:D-threo-aldose 1-dehydrogenase